MQTVISTYKPVVGLCWLLVVFRSLAEDNFIVAESTIERDIFYIDRINSPI